MAGLDPNLAIFQPGFWRRIGVGVLGVGMIIIGLLTITATSKTIQNVAKKAIDTTPQGAAVNAATNALE